MQTIDLRVEDISTLPERLVADNLGMGAADVIFADDTMLPKPVGVRSLILNVLFWEPNWMFGIKPDSTDYTEFKSFTPDSVGQIQTKLYEKALNRLPNVPHMAIVMKYLYNVDRVSNFVMKHFGVYMPTLDALALSRLMRHPKVTEITKDKVNDSMGTRVAEEKLAIQSKKLVELLNTMSADVNCLYPYMKAKCLKSNQIPQFFNAYGTRADIDNTMAKHVIARSSFEGLTSVEDYATEYLSAKKSIHLSRNNITLTQYFARKMRLACSSFVQVYPGSCGSEGWFPYTLRDEKIAANYIGRIIISDEGKREVITPDKVKGLVGQEIRLVSPFMCRHQNGICEYCAGYGNDRLIRYLPYHIHIGALCAFHLGSMISQQVLSTKHLINGVTLEIILPETAKECFIRIGGTLLWNDKMKQSLNNLVLRIPRKAIVGMLSDLEYDILPLVESFSRVEYFDLIKASTGEHVAKVDLLNPETSMFTPFLSEDMLRYMQAIRADIKDDKKHVDIPLAKFDPMKPVFCFTSQNFDISTYSNSIIKFTSAEGVPNYTSIPHLLEDFTALVYKKSTINSFWLEMLLRSMLVSGPDDYTTPIVTDPNNVMFRSISDVIGQRTITGKLAFEKVAPYISNPKTAVVPKPVGWFSPHFGLI